MQPVDPPVSRRGAVLFLVQTSASMAAPVPAQGDAPALGLALQLVGSTLVELLALVKRGELAGADWDVAVVGCRGGDPPPPVDSLLPGLPVNRPFVSLAELAESGHPVHRVRAEGPPPRTALAEANNLVQDWLAGQPAALPPLVVCCLDAEALGPEAARLADSIRCVCTPGGRAILAVCGFAPDVPRVIELAGRGGRRLPAAWQAIRAATSHGPPRSRAGKEPWRALAVNASAAPALVKLVRQAARAPRGEAGGAWRFGGAAPPSVEVHALWAPKDGNGDDEWQDGFAVDPKRGAVVVADGASAGIFSREWAKLLAGRWVEEPPDLANADGLNEWAAACRRTWREAIDYPSLSSLHQEKINTIGTGATLLALGLERRDGGHRWRAAAVGDSCLFCVRDGRLLLTFPLTRSCDFGVTPSLIPTLRLFAPRVRVVTAEGNGKLGDLYGLATDAVAQCLLQCHESGCPIDWQELWDMDDSLWRRRLQEWRAGRRIVNDDSTLVLVRVTQ